jgi:hypothetical protein
VTNDELDKLEAVAKAATPGPWYPDYDKRRDGADQVTYVAQNPHTKSAYTYTLCFMAAGKGEDQQYADVSFIAAANPATVLALIALCRTQSARIAEMEGVVNRLPKTKDGALVVPGMHVWFYSPRSFSQCIDELKVCGWEYLPGMEPGLMFVLNVVNEAGDSDGVNLECCYSTESAARSAAEAKEKA